MWWTAVARRLRVPWIDAGIAALFVAVMAVEAEASGWDHGPWLVASMVLLAWRRTWPTAVAAAVLLVAMLVDVDGMTTATLAIPLAAFTVGSELSPSRAARSLALLGVVAVAVLLAVPRDAWVTSDVAALMIFVAGPCLVGMSQHQRMRAEAVASARAVRAEEQASVAAERAAERERSRIARELHDIVSHSLTVVSINAQAVRRSLPPEQSRQAEALGAIEQTARDAGAEMRRLFGVLRAPAGEQSLEPQPGLAQLSSLVERCTTAGLAVRLDVDDSLSLSGGLDVTAYRIVQEALTNVLRHAGATEALVRVRGAGDHVEIEVEDDGRGATGEGDGHGLVGIHERALVYGGVAEARDTGSGFRVRVRLPVAGAG